MTVSRRLGPLRWRLLVAFAGVAVAAVGLLAALAVLATRSQVSSLVRSEQDATGRDVAVALATGYRLSGGWESADLSAAYALASSAGAQLSVVDASGRQLATNRWADMWSGMSQGEGEGEDTHEHGERQIAPQTGTAAQPVTTAGERTITVPVTVAGQKVGTATLVFAVGGDSSAAEQARDAIIRNVGVAAALALIVALVAGLLVSSRISRPLTALISAARAVERNGPTSTIDVPAAPGELGELTQAFARMSGALARQETARRAMAADVAHELRTPLTILRAETEQLVDGIAEPTPAGLVSLHDEVLRISRMVDDLGTLAAADSAEMTLHRETVDLAEVVAHRAAAFRPRVDDAGLTLVTELRPAVVDADPGRLDQIVTNLLGNATKFTPSGGRITVAVGPEDNEAVLTVTDTGPGIPADELPHLFERFWRGRRAARTGGSGIGLAVVAELVRAHDGTVEADSPAGRGATFTVRLPLTPAHVSAPRRSARR